MTSNKNISNEETVYEMGTLSIGTIDKKFDECEWVFQFDDDEPIIFAWTKENNLEEEPKIVLTIDNIDGSNIEFRSNGDKKFKIFARELTEAGRIQREADGLLFSMSD